MLRPEQAFRWGEQMRAEHTPPPETTSTSLEDMKHLRDMFTPHQAAQALRSVTAALEFKLDELTKGHGMPEGISAMSVSDFIRSERLF